VVVPPHLAEYVAEYAEEVEEAEAWVKERIEREGCSPGRYYPINDATMKLFREEKGSA
jgi:hypothetical protein